MLIQIWFDVSHCDRHMLLSIYSTSSLTHKVNTRIKMLIKKKKKKQSVYNEIWAMHAAYVNTIGCFWKDNGKTFHFVDLIRKCIVFFFLLLNATTDDFYRSFFSCFTIVKKPQNKRHILYFVVHVQCAWITYTTIKIN